MLLLLSGRPLESLHARQEAFDEPVPLLDLSILFLHGLDQRSDQIRVAQRQSPVRVAADGQNVVALPEEGLDVLSNESHVGTPVAALQLVLDRTETENEIEAERDVSDVVLGPPVG